ncbi:MAG: PKD domain-containing protein [Bacteroidetes bacterium]|nr:PKD domain-containing protein [Bacteroidota bacterium]
MKTKNLLLLIALIVSGFWQNASAQCTASFTMTQQTATTVAFTNTSTGNFANVSWYFGDGSTSSAANPMHTYAPGIYGVCLTIWDSLNGCQSYMCDTLVIANTGGCQAYFSPNNLSNNMIYFDNLSVGANATFFWNFDDGNTSTLANPIHTFQQPGSYTVCLTITTGNGCTDTYCGGIFIQNGSPCVADFNFTVQSGSTVAFTNSSSGNYANMFWDFGDGTFSSSSNPTHTFGPGIWMTCLTISDSLNGCQSTFCDSITINSSGNCVAGFVPNIQGNNVQFINTSTGLTPQVFWDFGDGTTSTLTSPSHQFSQPGIYSVCLTVSDTSGNCNDTYCTQIVIQGTGNCNAGFTAIDSSGMTWFFPTSYNPNYYYYWNFGDGNSSTQPYTIHQYNTIGTFLACLTVIDSANNCFDTYCDSVSNLLPVGCQAGFGIQQANGTGYFNGFNTGTGSVASYFWDFGDGNTGTGQFASNAYATPGTYTVCLTILTFNNCIDTVCNVVTITGSGNCNASFTYQSSNGTGSFFGSATGGNVSSWAWYFSDGTTATGQNPVHTFPSSGYWTACLFITTSNGCMDSTCQQVYIAGPISACQPYFTSNLGANNTVYFTDQSVGSPTNYYWNFGDGSANSTQMNPVHQYAQNGTYYVCLTIIDSAFGCTATYCDTVIIGNIIGNCNAQFQYFDSLNTFYFYSNGSPNYNYYWTFGDGMISYAANPTHVYSNPGGYSVCLTIYDSLNNCSDTWCDSIFIGGGAGCQAYFSYVVDTTTFATAFTNLSQGNYTNVTWSFGDGTSSNAFNPNHTYTSSGTYIVCLTIYNTNGCQSSYCDSIVIGSGVNCIPQYYAVPDSVFGNGNVTFYVFNSCSGWQYVWDFGDSTNGSGVGPFIHQYNATGWYYVCVTAFDNFGNTITWCDSVYAFRTGGTTGLSDPGNAIPTTIFPNPSSGPITVRFNLQAATALNIDILSIQGHLIHHIEQDYPSGLSEIRLDPSMWDAGMYILRLRTAEQQTNSRFIIQH